jgi:flagellar basal body rod protein FlgC
MDLSAIALEGLQQANTQLEKLRPESPRLAQPSSDGVNVDTVNLSVKMVALMSARNQTSVNLSILKTANEIQKNLIDLMV